MSMRQSLGEAGLVIKSSQSQNSGEVMQAREDKGLSILQQNSQLLRKLPNLLGRHLQIYQNLHRDLDSNEHHSGHYRNKDQSGDANVQKLANVSHQFVQALVRLKGNFTQLQNVYVRSRPEDKRKVEGDKRQGQGNNLGNFDLFVSEHCKNSAKKELKKVCEPLLRAEDLEDDHFQSGES